MKTQPRQLKPGHVLVASWGYEQTNVDYYQVTRLIGQTMVELVEIGRKAVYDSAMSGQCQPDTTHITGSPIRRKAKGTYVKINEVVSARKLEYKEVEGKRIYPSHYFSCYA